MMTALLFLILAPVGGGLLLGVDRVITARMQGRVGPPLLQPFYDVAKLLNKTARTVNPLQEPLLIGHLGFMLVAGAMMVGGGDLLLTAFLVALAALFLVLAAGCADSPFGATAAERELIVMLASEPLLILLLAGVCKVSGQTTYAGVMASPHILILALPGVFLAFVFIVTMKLRKSPFDVSVSHHAHQELVKGLTTDLSGRLLAYVEVAHWVESMVLLALLMLFFNGHVVIGLAVAAGVYLLEILVDNATARVRWAWLLGSSWAVTLLLGGGNVLAVFLVGG